MAKQMEAGGANAPSAFFMRTRQGALAKRWLDEQGAPIELGLQPSAARRCILNAAFEWTAKLRVDE